MATFGARQRPPDEPAAGTAEVEAGAGRAADIAGVGWKLEAEAGAADLVGRKSGPFCPQPVSSAAPQDNSTAETMMRRRMRAIRMTSRDEYKGAREVNRASAASHRDPDTFGGMRRLGRARMSRMSSIHGVTMVRCFTYRHASEPSS